jgi:hypothetical protein
LNKAKEKKYEDDLWEMWTLQYPQMDKESFISFKDYKKQNMIRQENRGSQISYEEIENEMNEVILAHEAKELKKN